MYYQRSYQKWSRKFAAQSWFKRKKWNTIKHKNLLSHKKIDKEFIKFGVIEIEKHTFQPYKSLSKSSM